MIRAWRTLILFAGKIADAWFAALRTVLGAAGQAASTTTPDSGPVHDETLAALEAMPLHARVFWIAHVASRGTAVTHQHILTLHFSDGNIRQVVGGHYGEHKVAWRWYVNGAHGRVVYAEMADRIDASWAIWLRGETTDKGA